MNNKMTDSEKLKICVEFNDKILENLIDVVERSLHNLMDVLDYAESMMPKVHGEGEEYEEFKKDLEKFKELYKHCFGE